MIATAPILYRALFGRSLDYAKKWCEGRYELDQVEEWDASA